MLWLGMPNPSLFVTLPLKTDAPAGTSTKLSTVSLLMVRLGAIEGPNPLPVGGVTRTSYVPASTDAL
jgi:hypothetical protein